MTDMELSIHLYKGELWHVEADSGKKTLRAWPRGALAVDEHGCIVGAGDARALETEFPSARSIDFGDAIILPGFVDAHLHFPQLDIIGCYGEQLIGWLNRYTFPAEAAFESLPIAKDVARRLITELLANGTTAAGIFSSTHRGATEALFAEALARGYRAVIGKVAMDRNAPDAILQCAKEDAADNEALIETWHGREGRLYCALTPRFAPTCSEELLASMGDLLRCHPEVYLQTHYAESVREIEWVGELFPHDEDYLAVYERFGLIGPRTLLAHANHVNQAALERISSAGATLVHCPTSNLFLGSGLFPYNEVTKNGIGLAIGTDIGAGTSLSMWRTLGEAYKVQQLRGWSVAPVELFHAATLGGAAALGMAETIGNFKPGKAADFQVLDWKRSRLLRPRFERGATPEERLFALMMLADDRLIEAVYIKGREVYGNPECEGETRPS